MKHLAFLIIIFLFAALSTTAQGLILPNYVLEQNASTTSWEREQFTPLLNASLSDDVNCSTHARTKNPFTWFKSNMCQ